MKKKIDYHEHDDVIPDISNVVSATETTGMMPIPPQNSEEYTSYQDLASMEIPKAAPGKPSNRERRKAKYNNNLDSRPRTYAD